MTLEILLRYLHFLGIIGVSAALVGEHLLIADQMTRAEIKRLSILDTIYGIAILLVIGVGLYMWLGTVGKPAEFYTKNGLFHGKLGMVLIMGLLSAPPTLFFFKNRKGDQQEIVEVPKRIVMFIRMELLFLVLIPLFAALMAKGVGYYG